MDFSDRLISLQVLLWFEVLPFGDNAARVVLAIARNSSSSEVETTLDLESMLGPGTCTASTFVLYPIKHV